MTAPAFVLPVALDTISYVDVILNGQQVTSEDFNSVEDIGSICDYYMRQGADYLSLVIMTEENPVILLDLSGENGPPASFPLYPAWSMIAA